MTAGLRPGETSEQCTTQTAIRLHLPESPLPTTLSPGYLLLARVNCVKRSTAPAPARHTPPDLARRSNTFGVCNGSHVRPTNRARERRCRVGLFRSWVQPLDVLVGSPGSLLTPSLPVCRRRGKNGLSVGTWREFPHFVPNHLGLLAEVLNAVVEDLLPRRAPRTRTMRDHRHLSGLSPTTVADRSELSPSRYCSSRTGHVRSCSGRRVDTCQRVWHHRRGSSTGP